MGHPALIENWRENENDRDLNVKRKRERGRGEDPEVLIGHWNGGEVEAGRGTEVEAVIEKETEETGKERGRKKMNVVRGKSGTMTKKEAVKGKESALGREIVLEKNQKTEKVKVKLKRRDIKMKKMKGNIGMRKEMPKRRGDTAGVEVGIESVGVEV